MSSIRESSSDRSEVDAALLGINFNGSGGPSRLEVFGRGRADVESSPVCGCGASETGCDGFSPLETESAATGAAAR
jgi:hypothetical protein